MVMHDDTEKLVTFEDISKRNNTQIKYKLFFFHSDNLGHKCWDTRTFGIKSSPYIILKQTGRCSTNFCCAGSAFLPPSPPPKSMLTGQ